MHANKLLQFVAESKRNKDFYSKLRLGHVCFFLTSNTVMGMFPFFLLTGVVSQNSHFYWTIRFLFKETLKILRLDSHQTYRSICTPY